MNFREELEKIRTDKREWASNKANEFLENALATMAELPSFKDKDSILIFPTSHCLVMQNTDRSPIYKMEFEYDSEISAVYRAVREKLTSDGCKYDESSIVENAIVVN